MDATGWRGSLWWTSTFKKSHRIPESVITPPLEGDRIPRHLTWCRLWSTGLTMICMQILCESAGGLGQESFSTAVSSDHAYTSTLVFLRNLSQGDGKFSHVRTKCHCRHGSIFKLVHRHPIAYIVYILSNSSHRLFLSSKRYGGALSSLSKIRSLRNSQPQRPRGHLSDRKSSMPICTNGRNSSSTSRSGQRSLKRRAGRTTTGRSGEKSPSNRRNQW